MTLESKIEIENPKSFGDSSECAGASGQDNQIEGSTELRVRSQKNTREN